MEGPWARLCSKTGLQVALGPILDPLGGLCGVSGVSEGALRRSWGVFLGGFVVIMGQMSGHVVGFALRTLFEHHFGRILAARTP